MKPIVGISIGAAVGWWLGAGIGIVSKLGAISGAVPLALAGAWLGARLTRVQAQPVREHAVSPELQAKRDAFRAARGAIDFDAVPTPQKPPDQPPRGRNGGGGGAYFGGQG
jgi:hypothetical protein